MFPFLSKCLVPNPTDLQENIQNHIIEKQSFDKVQHDLNKSKNENQNRKQRSVLSPPSCRCLQRKCVSDCVATHAAAKGRTRKATPRLQGSTATVLHSCKAPRPQCYTAARLHGRRAPRRHDWTYINIQHPQLVRTDASHASMMGCVVRIPYAPVRSDGQMEPRRCFHQYMYKCKYGYTCTYNYTLNYD